MICYKSSWKTPPQILTYDLVCFQALVLSIVRFAVEKYGGTMATDTDTGMTRLDIPDWAEEPCLRELGQLVGPGTPLNRYLTLLSR
ncbi:MAG: hypothetical protein JRI36_05250 [Deltaproteobacteria bacterium]|nr:hypothetical protein [Deltaproteobacteria bacterium]